KQSCGVESAIMFCMSDFDVTNLIKKEDSIMSKRVLIVGGVAGGASAAARVRRLDESAEVIMFEKGPHVSFSNCCLPNHLSGMIENSDDLVLMCPDGFQKQYNIEARVNSE